MWLKKKYTTPSSVKRAPYRTRTGPNCCGPGCPSTYKKTRRPARRDDRA